MISAIVERAASDERIKRSVANQIVANISELANAMALSIPGISIVIK